MLRAKLVTGVEKRSEGTKKRKEANDLSGLPDLRLDRCQAI